MWLLSPHKTRRSAPARRRPTCRLELEALEDRCLLSAGALDPTFGTAGIVTTTVGMNRGQTVLLQPDGKIVVAPQYGFVLDRFNTDGSLDTTFGTGGTVKTLIGNSSTTYAGAAALQSNGDILLGGGEKFTTKVGKNIVTTWEFALARYTPNGVLDSTFGNGGVVTTTFGGTGTNAVIGAVMVQPDGKIVAAGDRLGRPNMLLARYNSDGSLDSSFGTNGQVTITVPSSAGNWVNAAALQSDGKIVLAGPGQTSGVTHLNSFQLGRFNSNGTLDTTFGAGGFVQTSFPGNPETSANAVAIQSDGKIVVGGMTAAGPAWGGGTTLARYDASGNRDTTFGTGGLVTTPGTYLSEGMALQSDGSILVAGTVYVNSTAEFALGRYTPSGQLDSTFGTGGIAANAIGTGTSRAYGVAIYPQAGTANDGKIVGVGFSDVGGVQSLTVARYLAS